MDEELTISFLYRSPKLGHTVSTFRNVPMGSTWKMNDLDKDSIPAKPVPYKAQIQAVNVPPHVAYLCASSDFSRITDVKPGVNYPVNLTQPSGNEVWLRLEFTDGQPARFFLLQHAEANKTYPGDLSKFEAGRVQTIQLKEPDAVMWARIRGKQQDQVHTLFIFDPYPFPDPSLANAFSFYYPSAAFTGFTVDAYTRKETPQSNGYSDDQQQVYGSFETLPQTLPTLEADAAVQYNAAGRFRMTTTGDFDAYVVQGYTQGTPLNTSLHWIVTGKAQADTEFSFPEMPAEIFAKSSFEVLMKSVSIYEWPDLASYEEYLAKVRFADKPALVTGSQYTASRTRNLK